MSHDVFADLVDYLPALEPFVRDESVSELMVNPDGRAFVERAGKLEQLPLTVESRKLAPVIVRIAVAIGEWIDEKRPLLEARLPDGSRVAAACPPVSVGGWSISIRKFPTVRYSMNDLIHRGSISSGQAEFLKHAIVDRRNVLISGGTGSGKTTLLSALSEYIPDDNRVLLIEDLAEIVLPASKANVPRLEARRAQDSIQAVTIRDLLRHALRMRPDRVILGEVRGAEAFDLLQVLNSGHSGTLSTLHADSARKAIDRLTSLALIAKVLPPLSVRGEIGSSIHVIVQAVRDAETGRRFVKEIVEVDGYDFRTDQYQISSWSERKPVSIEDGGDRHRYGREQQHG